MLKKNKNNSGFSLVELIISLVIIALVYTVMLRVMAGQKSLGVKAELYTEAVFLSKGLMNRVLSKRFDENSQPPWTPITAFGPFADSDDYYDDIDDFAGYINNSIPDFPGFTEQVRVFYVSPSNLNDSTSSITHIKKIITTITHAGINPVTLETIISSHY